MRQVVFNGSNILCNALLNSFLKAWKSGLILVVYLSSLYHPIGCLHQNPSLRLVRMKQNGPSSSSATSLLCAIDPFCNPVDLSTGVVAFTTCSYYLFLLLVWVARNSEEFGSGVARNSEEFGSGVARNSVENSPESQQSVDKPHGGCRLGRPRSAFRRPRHPREGPAVCAGGVRGDLCASKRDLCRATGGDQSRR